MARLAMLMAAAVTAAMAPASAAPVPEKTYSVTVSPVPADKRAPVAYAGPLIVFKAVVAGRDVWAVVDSGAAKTAIDSGLVRELKLKLADSDGAANVAVLIPGQLSTRYQRLPVVDLGQAPGAEAGRKIGFVLGQDFLRDAVISVDPVRHTFELGPSGSLTPSGGYAFDLTRSQATMMIGGEPVRLAIDTGFNGQLRLGPAAWSRFVPKGASKLPEVDMGSATIGNVAVTEAAASGDFSDGALGVGLLNNFNFTLDLGARKLWIAPSQPAGR